MAKVTVMMLLTLMPISFAASLSSETAIIARPVLLYFTKTLRATITTTDAARVISVDTFMLSAPRVTLPRSGTATYLGAEPKHI